MFYASFSVSAVRPVCCSPPRVWGIRVARTGCGRLDRFTPTRVGNTRSMAIPFRLHSVHPHACGEYASFIWSAVSATGSPPRVWGILHARLMVNVFPRFTPTRVGNTITCASSSEMRAVHPHACGEYDATGFTQMIWFGSPPRVWGIRSGVADVIGLFRFTPTRVGNTIRLTMTCRGWPVHPHACGEYEQEFRAKFGMGGSPPRVWGIRCADCSSARLFRFTPTRVGNTLRVCQAYLFASVHPHACGEYWDDSENPHRINGSPPRVWGIPKSLWTMRIRWRFTPTRVGNTTLKLRMNPIASVHPHACGEY